MKGSAPDEIAIRHRRGKASQMLTTAKTDFKITIGPCGQIDHQSAAPDQKAN
jgi:hypothetical protein